MEAKSQVQEQLPESEWKAKYERVSGQFREMMERLKTATTKSKTLEEEEKTLDDVHEVLLDTILLLLGRGGDLSDERGMTDDILDEQHHDAVDGDSRHGVFIPLG